MGVIMHKNIPYGGGSAVEANVAGATPSENLSTLTIDGVTYDTTELVFCYDDNGSLYTDSTKATAVSGDDSKLYIATNTGKQYRYNGSAFSALGVNAINDLSDVTITSASDGQALEYDATAGKWKNVAKKAADTPTFSEASTRANLSGSGETMTTILGKIKKWFSDLKDLAFIGKDGTSSTKYLRGDGTWQNFPTIPTVNDATLTIQKNGTAVETFTANSSTNKTANITVPIKVSDLTDDVVSGHYLPLTGGTLTGNLNVSNNGASDTALYVRGNSQGAYIGFHNANGGTTYGYYGVRNDNKPYFYANNTSTRIALSTDIVDTKVTQNASTTDKWRKVLLHFHEDTTGGSSVTEGTDIAYGAVGVSVQPSTGTLKASSLISDGALNGDFKNQRYVNLASLDTNTWYPVTGTAIGTYNWGMHRMCVHVALNSSTVPSWCTHNRGFSVDLDILAMASAWGVSTPSTLVLNHTVNWVATGQPSPAGYSQMTNSSTPVFWLRGGGNYYIYTDYPCEWTVRTSTYTASSQSVAPTTTYPGVAIASTCTMQANLNGVAYWANELNNYYTSRPASANVASDNRGGIRKFLATSSMTTGKPINNGHIVHFDWDNGSTYASQLFVPADGTEHMQFRCQNNNNWSNWCTLIDSNNISSQSVDQATKDGDGNTISSTYWKKTQYPKTGKSAGGSATAAITGYRDVKTIEVDQGGVFLVIAFVKFSGGTGRRAVLITNSNDNPYAQTWDDSTIASGDTKQIVCCHNLVVSDSSVPIQIKLRVYTANNDTTSISGTIAFIRLQ